MSAWTVGLLVASPLVGRFLGLLVDRLPNGRPVVFGRSRCEACGAAPVYAELVPLLGCAIGRGRCRRCDAPFHPGHPLMELGAVAVAVWSVTVVPGLLALPTAALGWALLALAEIDRRHFLLPDALTFPVAAGGLAVSAWLGPESLEAALVGLVTGALSLFLVRLVYASVRGREGLGLGDVKLFAAAGAWVGWQALPSVLLLACAIGLGVLAVQALAGGRPSRTAEMPMGTFLAAGTWLTWLYGPLGLSH